MLEYKFDTQLLIEGEDLDEDAIHDYLMENIPGDCLIAVGDEDLIKIHYHTGVLRRFGGDPRHCGGEHGAAGRGPARLIHRQREGAWERPPIFLLPVQ